MNVLRGHSNFTRAGIQLITAVSILLLAGVSCESPHDSIQSILDRQQKALTELPAEDKERMIAPTEEITTESAGRMIEPGILTLQEARNIVLKTNPDMHAARARLESALARISEARSFYFPSVELSHNSSRTFMVPSRRNFDSFLSNTLFLPGLATNLNFYDVLSTVGRFTESYTVQQALSRGTQSAFSNHTTTLGASWTLFDGFIREARLMSRKQSYLASAMALADAKRLLVKAVDAAYFQTQLGRERLRVAKADEEFSREQLEFATKRWQASKISKAEVLNFRLRVRGAQANVVTAKGMRDTGRVILAELLALPGAELPDDVSLAPLEKAHENLELQDEDEWTAKAMGHRPDLSQVKHAVKAREENILIAKGQFYPELNLRGNWGFESVHNMDYSEDDQSSAIQLEFRWPLYTGGFRTSQVRRAHAEWWEAQAALDKKKLEIGRQIREAVIKLTNAQEQVRLQRANMKAARENRRLVEKQYEAGKASLVRLNEAQRDFVETDGELARARIRLRQAWSELNAAAGSYYKKKQPPLEAIENNN
jgi:outer membrane protein TolC